MDPAQPIALAISGSGQAVGDQKIHEIIACWYPVHKIFLDLYKAPDAAENFRLKGLCVEYAVIHRCPGGQPPFAPSETAGEARNR